MKTGSSSLLAALLLSAVLLSSCCEVARGQTPAVLARITQSIDEKSLLELKGNVHPLARPEYDQGRVSDDLTLHRMLLLLQRGPDQEAALARLLDDQQDKSSPNYHVWLTPQQFGQQFGPADADIQTVSSWLQSHGFQITNVTAGRTLIEFSGTAAQVRAAFHTEIHNYLVHGELHTANATDPQIPAALAPVVVGPVSLNSFPITSHLLRLGTFYREKNSNIAKPLDKPLTTIFSGCIPACYGVGPGDFATIYNSNPLLTGNPKIDGTGQSIAIVGESDIDPTDVTDFQTMFGMTPNFSTANIVVNGADPGKNGSEGESDLDVQWASAVAPGAAIKFVTSEPTETTAGIFLSAVYIVDNNLAGVMSESFGGCEQLIGSLNQFHNSLWQQASAQGITAILSAGDGGSAGCDNFDTAQTATQGLAVSGFASTPYNIAVGGTDFDDVNRWSQFWSNTNNSQSQSSALSYIPEIPWNDSCAQLGITGCGPSAPNGSLNIVAGSGGASVRYPMPSWQVGIAPGSFRDLPDVALFASNGFDRSFYIMCQKDLTTPSQSSCNLSDLGFTFQGVGGTSVAAPAFAGIMALVNQGQATSTPPNPSPRQGNANYVLYKLFQKQTGANPAINCNSSATPSTSCTFYDVTRGNSALPTGVGTNSVPCAATSPNCSNKTTGETNGVLVTPTSSTTEAYTVATGYDLATGLGSVNIANLVNNWSSVMFLPSTTTLSATLNGQPTTSITGTHGTAVNVTSTVSAGQGASGTPSGQVALLASPNPGTGTPGPSLGFDVLNLANGTASGTGVVLPGGQYSLTAHYQGDGTFGSSDSTPPISVNIAAEPSKTVISIPVFDPSTGRETGNAPTSLVYASPYIARVDVGNAQATLSFPQQPLCTPPSCPTGTITWTDSYNNAPPMPLDTGTFALNSQGSTEDQRIQLPGGSHILSASYSGDSSFGPSSSTYMLTVSPAPTTTGPGNPSLPPQISTPFGLSAIVTSQNLDGAMESCNVTFFDGTTPVPGTVTCTGFAGGTTFGASIEPSIIVNQATAGTHTYTAKFNGDSNYAPSTSAPMTTRVFYGTTTTLSADSTNVQYGSSITLTAVIDSMVPQGPPIGQLVNFSFDNNPVTGTVTYSPFTDASGNVALRASLTTVPQSSGFYSAIFAGDSNYSQSVATLNINVNIPDFTLSASLVSSSITAGSSGMATVTVTPASNASSPVTLACPAINPLLGQPQPAGISCNFSPNMVNLSNGAAATSTLTIASLAPSSSNSTSFVSPQPQAQPRPRPFYSPPHPNWPLPIVSILILFMLLLRPTQLRRKRLLAISVCVCALSLLFVFYGCGGGSSGGGGGGGPVPTSITLTTSSVKVPYNSTSGGSVTLTANITSSKPAGGTVTFSVDGPSGFSVSSPAVNGVAPFQLTGLAVGIHTITAKYSGDADTLASQTSGSLNIAVTGQATLAVQGSTGGLLHTTGLNFTLQ